MFGALGLLVEWSRPLREGVGRNELLLVGLCDCLDVALYARAWVEIKMSNL